MRSIPVALALVALGGSGSVVGQTAQDRPTIIVDGNGEVKTMPDLATIGYTLRGEGPTSDDAVRAMVTMGTRIEAALGRVDATAEPRTDKVEVAPVKGPDCKERQDYGESSPQMSTGSCAIVGYVATKDVTVKTSDIKDAGTMVGLAGRGGAYDAAINSFDLRDPKPAQRQAIASALADAQAKAAAIAAGSHLNLGPIMTVSTGGRADTGEAIVVTGTRRKFAEVPAPPPVPVNVAPQPISTTANVTVTYAIAR